MVEPVQMAGSVMTLIRHTIVMYKPPCIAINQSGARKYKKYDMYSKRK